MIRYCNENELKFTLKKTGDPQILTTVIQGEFAPSCLDVITVQVEVKCVCLFFFVCFCSY